VAYKVFLQTPHIKRNASEKSARKKDEPDGGEDDAGGLEPDTKRYAEDRRACWTDKIRMNADAD